MICDYNPDIFTKPPPGATAAEVDRITADNEARAPFYLALRFLLPLRFGFTGTIPPTAESALDGLDDKQKAYFLGVAGLMIADGYKSPVTGKAGVMGADDISAFDDQHNTINISRTFSEGLVREVAFYNSHFDLFQKIYGFLRDEGTGPDPNGQPGDECSTVKATDVANVARRLIENRTDPNDPQLRRRALNVLSAQLAGDVQGRSAAIDIDLPDLDEDTAADIIPDNVRALSAVYFAAMLEDLKMFSVADKVAEQFMVGMLPLSRGAGGEALYDYIKNAHLRLTTVERQSLYLRAFGIAGGSVEEPMPNAAFTDTMMRFAAAVSGYKRQSQYQRITVTSEMVFKAAKDLAVNLSLHGFGMAHFAAVELQKLVKDVKTMLSFPDIISAYGTRDVWQLVERVSQLYLGGSANGVRQRTMATAGANIIQWLADNARILSSPFASADLDAALAQNPDPAKDLGRNVERWLAVTGTTDQTVERFSEPVAIPSQATIPTMSLGAMPDAFKDAMSKLNMLGAGNNLANMPKA